MPSPEELKMTNSIGAETGKTGEPLLDYMRARDIPLTRQNYMDLAYGKNVPEWTPELEAELPAEIRGNEV